MALSPEQYDELRRRLLLGDPIAAVRYARACTGWDQERAKVLVYDELRRIQGPDAAPPARVRPNTTHAPEYSEEILSQIIFLKHAALQSLRQVQREIERITAGANYQVSLDTKAVSSTGGRLPLLESVHTCFPEVPLEASKFKRCSVEQMKAHITECLFYEGDAGSGPLFTDDRRERLARSLIPSYWELVWQMVEHLTTSVHPYAGELIGYPVFWDFAYVLRSHDESRCLIVAGVASD